MEPAIINLVLNRLQKVMVPNRVFTRFGRRPGYQKDPGLIGSDEIRVIGVVSEPLGTLMVPIGDLGAEGVGRIRITLLVVVANLVDEDLGDVEGGVVVGVVGGGFGLDFFEDAVGLHAPGAGVEEVLDLVEVLLGGAELSGADGAAENDDGEEEAQEGEGAAPQRPLDLADAARPQAPLQHFSSELTRPSWMELPTPTRTRTRARARTRTLSVSVCVSECVVFLP